MTDSTFVPSRRSLLGGSLAAVAAAGLDGLSRTALAQAASASAPAAAPAAKPLPAFAAWKDGSVMIVHGANALETRRGALGSSVITPADRLYVRNNLPAPDAAILADRDAWVVQVDGVKNPRALTVKELKGMGLETVAMVLQCSGNGRGMFPSKPSGSPWQVGAAGCVLWSGVPVRAVVEALGGPLSGLKYMTGTGGEKLPEGVDPRTLMVERSVPLEAMGDALLAWELNGAPIPLAHGGPLRLIVPGYTGVNNIKYIKRLAFTAEQSEAAIQQHGYRMTALGQKSTNADPSVWEMGVKSWINGPLPDSGALAAGPCVIHGVAFGGLHAVKRVEVSVDDGKTWQEAKLVGPDLGRYAWRQFALAVKLPAGMHTLLSRAEDSKGNRQPELRVENAHGYGNTSWRDHGVKVVVA
ncbi:sulfite oxidase [Pseudoduganella ginsengisoli]|uniref:Molybdopterin-dependent oxidoreductase n=1 Tax=Pseudoduganella ginsengisoli TaxID=1462440 RepID=A0A6L6Q1L3_9BURK|nr:sulfite oxidase [Pseudoduganella ginsengisoli]MTW03707.1 molybdopterin-dependent oxidoreductase [Pseudoduganella ginsengisoli]